MNTNWYFCAMLLALASSHVQSYAVYRRCRNNPSLRCVKPARNANIGASLPAYMAGQCYISEQSGRAICYPKYQQLSTDCNKQRVKPPDVLNTSSRTHLWSKLKNGIAFETYSYVCSDGYEFVDEANKVFCVAGEWFGTVPICVPPAKTGNFLPQVSVVPNQRLYVRPGGSVYVDCTAIARPPALIRWHDESLTTGNSKIQEPLDLQVISGRADKLLTNERVAIHNITSHRRLVCTANNTVGSVGSLIDIIVKAAKPQAPSNFTLTTNYEGRSAKISWAEPDADILGYTFYYKPKSSSGKWSKISSSTPSVNLRHLLPNEPYYFRVSAYNAYKSSDPSKFMYFTLSPGPSTSTERPTTPAPIISPGDDEHSASETSIEDLQMPPEELVTVPGVDQDVTTQPSDRAPPLMPVDETGGDAETGGDETETGDDATETENGGTGDGDDETETEDGDTSAGEDDTKTGDEETGTGDDETETGDDNPEAGEEGTETRDDKTETGDGDTETGDGDTAARDGDTETGDGDTETGDADTETGDGDTAAGDDDTETGDGDTAAGDDDTETGDGDTAAGDDDTETGDGDTSAGDGDTAAGDGDTAAGDGDTETGDGDTAPGDGDTETGDGDTAAGDGDTETGDGDTETGDGDTETGDGDTAAGDGDTETGDGDTAAGDGDTAAVDGDSAVGDGDTETGDGDTETGDGDTAAGDGDTAAGDGDTAAGDGDTETGDGDTETGDGDTAAGEGDTETGDGDTAAGDGETTAGDGDTETGDGDTAAGENDTETGDGDTETGNGDTAAGDGDTETGDGDTKTVDGDTETGDGDTAAGDGDTAAGDDDTAAGDGDTETGDGDTAAGDGDTETGDGDTAAGDGDTAAGDGDTAAGDGDTETGDGDTAAGEGDTETGDGDTAAGDGETTAGDGDTETGDGDTAAGENDTETGDGDTETGDDATATGDGETGTGNEDDTETADGDTETGDGDTGTAPPLFPVETPDTDADAAGTSDAIGEPETPKDPQHLIFDHGLHIHKINDFEANNIDTHSIELKWSAFPKPEAEFYSNMRIYYTIDYANLENLADWDSHVADLNNIRFDEENGKMYYTLNGLDAGQKYGIRIGVMKPVLPLTDMLIATTLQHTVNDLKLSPPMSQAGVLNITWNTGDVPSDSDEYTLYLNTDKSVADSGTWTTDAGTRKIQVPTNRRNYVIEHLQENTTYYGMMETGDGFHTDVASGRTLAVEDLMLGAPSKFQVTAAQDNVTISWAMPERVDSSVEIKKYHVYYTNQTSDRLADWNVKEVEADDRPSYVQYTIYLTDMVEDKHGKRSREGASVLVYMTNMHEASSYSVLVQAFGENSAGTWIEGHKSYVLTVDTTVKERSPEIVLFEPEGEVIEVTPGEDVLLKCTVMGTPEPDIFWFVGGEPVYSDSQHSTIQLNTTHFRSNFTASSLYEDTEVQCMAQNIAGSTYPVAKTLKIMGPGAGPVIQRDETGRHTLDSEGRPVLQWKQACCHNGPITYYDLYYIVEDKSKSPLEEWTYVKTPKTNHVFEKLDTGKQYAIKLRAVNERGKGPFTEFTMDTATREKSARIEKFHPVDGNVRAYKGQDVQLNCTVTGFPTPIILWRLGDDMIFGSKVVHNGEPWRVYDDLFIDSILTISHLTAGGKVSCEVENAMGADAIQWDINVVSGPEKNVSAVPSKAPDNLNVRLLHNGTLEFTWFNTGEDVVQGYNIYLSDHVDADLEQWTVISLTHAESGDNRLLVPVKRIPELKYLTDYSAKIQAVNELGKGPMSQTFMFNTAVKDMSLRPTAAYSMLSLTPSNSQALHVEKGGTISVLCLSSDTSNDVSLEWLLDEEQFESSEDRLVLAIPHQTSLTLSNIKSDVWPSCRAVNSVTGEELDIVDTYIIVDGADDAEHEPDDEHDDFGDGHTHITIKWPTAGADMVDEIQGYRIYYSSRPAPADYRKWKYAEVDDPRKDEYNFSTEEISLNQDWLFQVVARYKDGTELAFQMGETETTWPFQYRMRQRRLMLLRNRRR